MQKLQLSWRDALFRSEVDVGFAIHGTVVAQEVQEGDRTADTGFCDEGSTLARRVDSAGIVGVNAHLNVRVVVVHVYSRARTFVHIPARFVWVAGVLAPHALEVRRADRAVRLEDAVQLLVVVHHDRRVVRVAAQGLRRVEERARLREGILKIFGYHLRSVVARPEDWNGDFIGILASLCGRIVRGGICIALTDLPDVASLFRLLSFPDA